MEESISISQQREIYKVVEKLVSGNFREPLALLKRLVKDLVNHKGFNITGGRVWELLVDEMAYVLRMQYGNVEKIPEGYKIYIQDQPFLSRIVFERTMVNIETDKLLKEKGIQMYSASGVGPIIRTRDGKFYKYLLGFNGPEIDSKFIETLTVISSVATISIKNIVDNIEKKKIRDDLYQAAQIQKNLLPDHYLEFLDYEIFGVCIPDSAVGGDYFDYLKMEGEEERLGIVISDAASKGLSAAVQALYVSGAMRMGWSYSIRMSDLFKKLNHLVYKAFPYERFVTLFYCELTNTSNRLVLYVNAGHCAPIHYRARNDKISKLLPTGGLLGLLPEQNFKVENIQMGIGDILLLYTDGISDALDSQRNIYGEDRLVELLRKNKDLNSKEIAYSIIEDVHNFQGQTEVNDDKTIIVVKRAKK
ncbi:MAG: serine/threonine-protein phosphatase [Ignavibacteria bacterium]|nr:serine/threonine-protein phosphatase [Ignavibacteria bacterium]